MSKRRYLPRGNIGFSRGKKSHQKGFKAERKFLNSFFGDCFLKPLWFVEIRKASRQEDMHEGKDFIVLTRFCNIPVQIKSSLTGVTKFINSKKGKDFRGIILIVKLYQSYEEIRTIFFERAEVFLKNFLENKGVKVNEKGNTAA